MMLNRATFAAAAVGLFVALTAPAATAHVRDGKNRWLFTGNSYKHNSSLDEDNIADPLTLMFRGGSSLDSETVRNHIEDDWTKRRIPSDIAKREPDAGQMKNRPAGFAKNRLCRSVQDVWMRDGRWDPHRDTPRQYMSTSSVCGNQYHVRMWSDRLHSQYFGHSRDWVIASIHHDNTIWKCVRRRFGRCVLKLPGHGPPNQDWDISRYIAYKALGRHCTYPHWAIHSSARGKRGKYWNSGIITRISMRHTASGCSGA